MREKLKISHQGKQQFLKIILIVYLISCFQVLTCQVESLGTPYLNKIKSANKNTVVNIDSIVSIQLKNNNTLQQSNSKIKRFAQLIDVSIDFFENANSYSYMNELVYELAIKATGALSLGVLFSEYKLPEGAKLFIVNERSESIGAFTNLNNKQYSSLMVKPINGNLITIQLQLPSNPDFFPEISIGGISYGFYLAKSITNTNAPNSGFCNLDVNCIYDEGIMKNKKSVVKILGNGKDLCTGILINNTRNDGKAYVYTANHCVASHTAATNSIFYFNYASLFCDGPYDYQDQTISGSTLLATKKSLDFTLLELSIEPPFFYKPYYAGWSRDSINITNTYTIHHPSGDIKKYSVDNDPPVIVTRDGLDDNALYKITEWDIGTTEGGSSGGPLFNQNHKVIGDLTGGDASCFNSVNDYYVRFSRSWDTYADTTNQLKAWLDPDKSDVIEIDGYEPYLDMKEHIFNEYNIGQTENVIVENDGDAGYISGHNNKGSTLFAEHFNLPENSNIFGVYLNVAKAEQNSLHGKVRLEIWKDNLNDESIIYSYNLNIDYFQEGYKNLIEFDKYIPVSGDIYIGYRIFYLDDNDYFAVYHAEPRTDNSNNTAFVYQYDKGWLPLYSVMDKEFGTSLDIKPVYYNATNIDNKNITSATINLFPNPCNNEINVNFDNIKVQNIAVYNINGTILYNMSLQNSNNSTTLNTSKFKSGLYILRVTLKSEVLFYKFLVDH